jgi:hypothetical protein
VLFEQEAQVDGVDIADMGGNHGEETQPGVAVLWRLDCWGPLHNVASRSVKQLFAWSGVDTWRS